ncbi:MAG: methionyl-tRNA formyltransferase [Elusimicrobiota bacterium]|jgi:methionyl-tRNA formyltransferase|nr:methionyl-tRNA formyltransferase [Elusimicrobiota bacterium]
MNIIAVCNNLYDKTSLVNKEGFFYIRKKDELSFETLKKINPRYVFIPHWSYIIPKEIYENFECIIFHETDLPFGRGGSPVQNLIERGIYETKISAIKCCGEIDGGDIYLKKDFSLKEGSAKEIFERIGETVSKMIDEIIKTEPVPVKQSGKITLFKRRTPAMSNLKNLKEITKIYDYIRMLDCGGYPKAFLENEKVKYEFFDAKLENGNISAKVKIEEKQ